MGSTICSLPARFAEFYRGGAGGSCTLVKGRAQRARCGKSLRLCSDYLMHAHPLPTPSLSGAQAGSPHSPPPHQVPWWWQRWEKGHFGVDQKAWGTILGTESEA